MRTEEEILREMLGYTIGIDDVSTAETLKAMRIIKREVLEVTSSTVMEKACSYDCEVAINQAIRTRTEKNDG